VERASLPTNASTCIGLQPWKYWRGRVIKRTPSNGFGQVDCDWCEDGWTRKRQPITVGDKS